LTCGIAAGLVLEVDAELPQLDDRCPAPTGRVGRERQHERHPIRLAKLLAVAQDTVVPRGRLDREALGLESPDELANVLPHLGHGARTRISLPGPGGSERKLGLQPGPNGTIIASTQEGNRGATHPVVDAIACARVRARGNGRHL
jgi:hypothetical protein